MVGVAGEARLSRGIRECRIGDEHADRRPKTGREGPHHGVYRAGQLSGRWHAEEQREPVIGMHHGNRLARAIQRQRVERNRIVSQRGEGSCGIDSQATRVPRHTCPCGVGRNGHFEKWRSVL